MSELASKISRDMTFGDLLKQFPDSGSILMRYGLHCIGCHIGISETIEQGARAHGLDDDRINLMMKELNDRMM